MTLRWESWKRHVAPVLGYAFWGWLWDKDTAARIDTTVQRILRLMMKLYRWDDEGWLDWHKRSLGTTKLWVTNREDAHGPTSFQAKVPRLAFAGAGAARIPGSGGCWPGAAVLLEVSSPGEAQEAPRRWITATGGGAAD